MGSRRLVVGVPVRWGELGQISFSSRSPKACPGFGVLVVAVSGTA
jgi:hypothetical protein